MIGYVNRSFCLLFFNFYLKITLPLLVSQAVRRGRRTLQLILLLTLSFSACGGPKNSGADPSIVGDVKEISTEVKAISAGYSHTVTVKDDGTVWAWGRNNEGQLGDGTKTSTSTPIRVILSD
ncbi:MAG: hypothetical protein FWF73_06390 [Spirochaetes bacterium]|nr:hypothetical protein [Spirochaetota bacterium]